MGNDKIRIAEAMGWRWEPLERPSTNTGKWYPPQSSPLYQGPNDFIYGTQKADLVFDPFTDANDDYAVLEWMRGDKRPDRKYHPEWSYFNQELALIMDEFSDYTIGDYARAALKAIETVEVRDPNGR